MSINNDPVSPEQTPIVEDIPAADPTDSVLNPDGIATLPEEQPVFAPEDEQVQVAGKFGNIGKALGKAFKEQPRVDRVAAETVDKNTQQAESLMERVSDYADPTTVSTVRWNADYIDDVDDIVNVLKAGHDEFDFEVNHAALKVQGHDETILKAQQMSDDDFATKVLRYKPGQAWNAAELTRGRMMMTKIAADVYEYGGKVGRLETDATGNKTYVLTTTDEQELYQLHKMLNALSAVQYATEGAISEAGRSLNAMKVRVGSAMLDQSNVKNRYRALGGTKYTQKLLNEVMTGDFMNMAKTAKKATGDWKWNLFKDMFHFGNLSAFSTQAKNIIGNTITSVNAIPERYMAVLWGEAFEKAGVNKLASMAGKDKWGASYADRVALQDANDMAGRTLTAYILAFKLLGRRMGNGAKSMTHDALDIVGKGDLVEPGAAPNRMDQGHVAYDDNARTRGFSVENFNQSSIPALANLTADSVTGKAINFIGNYLTGYPSNILETMDDFYKTIAYEQAVYTRASKVARNSTDIDPNNPDEFFPYLYDLRENPTPDMEEASLSFMREQTFTKDLESELGQKIMQLQSVPLINVFNPYIKTMSNIMDYATQRFPVRPKVFKDIMAGGETRDMAMAKLSTGAIMAGVLKSMWIGETKEVTVDGQTYDVHLPQFTGAGAANPMASRVLEAAGWKPYSWRMDDGTYMPYDWIEPFGMMAAPLATLFEVENSSYDDVAKNDVLLATVGALADYFNDKSAMTGFTQMLDIASGDKSPEKFLARTATGLVMPRVATKVRMDLDPLIRGSNAGHFGHTIAREFLNKTPWLSEYVPPYVDMYGEDLKYGDPLWGLHSLSPTMTYNITRDPIRREIAKLYKPNEEEASRFTARKPSPVIKWLVQIPGSRISHEVNVDLRTVDGWGWAVHDWEAIVGKRRYRYAKDAIEYPGWDKLLPNEKYMEVSRAWTDGAADAKDEVIYGVNPSEDAKNFINKYRDSIQSEAERVLNETMNFQGGQFDYLPEPPAEPKTNQSDIPEF